MLMAREGATASAAARTAEVGPATDGRLEGVDLCCSSSPSASASPSAGASAGAAIPSRMGLAPSSTLAIRSNLSAIEVIAKTDDLLELVEVVASGGDGTQHGEVVAARQTVRRRSGHHRLACRTKHAGHEGRCCSRFMSITKRSRAAPALSNALPNGEVEDRPWQGPTWRPLP